MKKIILSGLMVVMLASFAWAMGGFMMPDILSKSPVVQLKGEIAQVGINSGGWMHQGGVVIKTSKGNVNVYGCGPMGYWNQNNATLQKGENVTVSAYKVNINGEVYYVAKDVTFANGKTIQLRNNNGYPMWMGKGHGGMMMNGQNGHMMNNGNYNNYNNCPDMHNNCPHMNNMNHQ